MSLEAALSKGEHDLPVVTRRLVLREPVEEDLPDVHTFFSDPEVGRFMHHLPQTLEETRASLREAIAEHNRGHPHEVYHLAIVHRNDRRVIGWITIGRSSRQAAEGELAIGFVLDRGYWGQGYATDAVRAALIFCLQTLRAPGVFAWCYADNPASAKVLQKAWMRIAGRYPYVRQKDGQPSKRIEYVICLKDFQAQDYTGP